MVARLESVDHNLRKARIVRRIHSATTFAVVGHIRPDADAIGSVTAFVAALRALGKDAHGYIGQDAPIPANLLSIPGAHNIRHAERLPEVDMIVVCDCGSVDRTGSFVPDLQDQVNKVIVVDHHASNAGFGSIDLIDHEAESTTVILAELIDALGVEIDRDMAHSLYAGLFTDTGSFHWGRASMHTLAARLMDTGIDIRQISEDLLDATTPEDLHVIGTVLKDLRIEHAGEVTLGILVADHEAITHASEGAVDTLVDFVRAIAGTDIGCVFKENHPHFWSVSLRSATTDVSRIAGLLGGGGHVPAAGYTTYGPVDHVIEELVRQLGSC